MLAIILIVVLVLMLLASLPFWRYSKSWGYYPVIVIGMLLLGAINLAAKGHL